MGGTYACTAVTDSWLVLLQRCMHAAAALQAAARGRHEAGAVLDAARAAASGMGAFQELLDQLLMHWQVSLDWHGATTQQVAVQLREWIS